MHCFILFVSHSTYHLCTCRSLMAFNLIYLFDQAESLKELAVELLDLQLPPPNIAATFAFNDAPAAIRYLKSGVATGKVVLELWGAVVCVRWFYSRFLEGMHQQRAVPRKFDCGWFIKEVSEIGRLPFWILRLTVLINGIACLQIYQQRHTLWVAMKPKALYTLPTCNGSLFYLLLAQKTPKKCCWKTIAKEWVVAYKAGKELAKSILCCLNHFSVLKNRSRDVLKLNKWPLRARLSAFF